MERLLIDDQGLAFHFDSICVSPHATKVRSEVYFGELYRESSPTGVVGHVVRH